VPVTFRAPDKCIPHSDTYIYYNNDLETRIHPKVTHFLKPTSTATYTYTASSWLRETLPHNRVRTKTYAVEYKVVVLYLDPKDVPGDLSDTERGINRRFYSMEINKCHFISPTLIRSDYMPSAASTCPLIFIGQPTAMVTASSGSRLQKRISVVHFVFLIGIWVLLS